MEAMPAPIDSPTLHPLRRADLMRNSDIGPSWRATKNPRPKPTMAAFIDRTLCVWPPKSCEVGKATGCDPLPEDQGSRQASVRLERVAGNLSGKRESQSCIQARGAAVDGCVEHQQGSPPLGGDCFHGTHQRGRDPPPAMARAGHELGHLGAMRLVGRQSKE